MTPLRTARSEPTRIWEPSCDAEGSPDTRKPTSTRTTATHTAKSHKGIIFSNRSKLEAIRDSGRDSIGGPNF